jgi:hypothetical protein
MTSVVHPGPDPAGSEIIYKLGSGAVINSGSDSGSRFGSGFESVSKLSSVFLTNKHKAVKMYGFKKN